jgi:endonuclease/exonuclease/phosphatase family metal-dependent hydrolase
MRALGLFVGISAAMLAGDSASPPVVFQGSFFVGNSAPAHGSSAALKVLDWNIHKGSHLEKLIQTARAERPDVCLFQEVDWNARRTGRRRIAEDLARALGMNYVYAGAFEELAQGSQTNPAYNGQAILSTLPILSSRVLRFKIQSGFWKPHSFLPNIALMQRRTGGRIALIAELQSASGSIIVYNLHLESRGWGRERREQLDEALADARRYGPDTPVIMAGDFNVAFYSRQFVARLQREGFESCFGDRKIRTHILAGALDWIFVRKPFSCESAQVIRGTGASDHDPLTATLRLRDAVRRSAHRGAL